MKNKFGFSIKPTDTNSIKIANELFDYCYTNGVSFSFIITEALKLYHTKVFNNEKRR